MPAQYYRPNAEKVAAEIIDGEAIIINVATGNYYNTEGIGGWAWEQCVAGKGTDEIAALVESRYEVSVETARQDLQAFFTSLEEEELVTGSEQGNAAAVPLQTGEARLAYRSPKLVAYRDLKDLLALDPPMPRLGADKTDLAPSPTR